MERDITSVKFHVMCNDQANTHRFQFEIYILFKIFLRVCTFDKELQNAMASSQLRTQGCTVAHFNINNQVNARFQSWELRAGIQAYFPRVPQSTRSGSKVRQGNALNLINYQSPGSGISRQRAGALPSHPPPVPQPLWNITSTDLLSPFPGGEWG